jgi:PAP2 superfamily protein
VAIMLFNKAVLDFKPNIPLIKPFVWDESLMKLDRLLHFGTDPWRLLQPILGHEWITYILNLDYNFWFLALFALWFWFAFRPDFAPLRTRFFLSYMITWWLGGGLLAYFLSSAGPCYYALIGVPEDPFGPQLAYLANVDAHFPLGALDAQKLLWEGYIGKVLPAMGISAFPSMHNAMAMIFVLVGFRLNRWLGIAFAINMAGILLGSVHLAWHYAVDAYAGIFLALAGWWIAGPLTHWFHSLAPSRAWQERLAEQG